MKYIHEFRVMAMLSFEIPGVTEMMNNFGFPGVCLASDGHEEVSTFKVTTSNGPLDAQEIEAVIQAAITTFEEQKTFSNVRVSFIAYEEVEDD